MKKIIRYLIYSITIFGYIFSTQYLLIVLQQRAAITFKPAGLIATTYFVYIVMGALLGIEHILNNKKEKCSWRLNLEKLTLVGVPALILSNLLINIRIQQWLHIPVNQFNQSYILFPLVFGYILITSFYKEK